MKKLTFRIIKFQPQNRYIGVAWNYDECCLISTRDYPDYTSARQALGEACFDAGAILQWFDGEYVRKPGSDLLEPISGG